MIAGLQKMTLLDFPGKVACTLFLGGCNFRCPFCHNSGLLAGESAPFMDNGSFLSFLKSRTGLLEGVCVTGGEPTLDPELPQLLRQIKALGFAVKLDTNGSRPDVLKAVAAQGLVDYVAMDVKNCPRRYGQTVGVAGMPLDRIKESLAFLLSGKLPFELRTTVVMPLHDEQAMEEMGRWLLQLGGGKPVPRLFLQPFEDRDTVLFSGMTTPPEHTLLRFADILAPYVEQVHIRSR